MEMGGLKTDTEDDPRLRAEALQRAGANHVLDIADL